MSVFFAFIELANKWLENLRIVDAVNEKIRVPKSRRFRVAGSDETMERAVLRQHAFLFS